MTLSEQLETLANKLKSDILHVSDVVAAALESGDRQKQHAAGPLIPPLVERYSELLRNVDETERNGLERLVGRMLTDLRRQASALAKQEAGQRAKRAADAGQPFLLSRPVSVKEWSDSPRPRAERAHHAVGGEVEAWCGKCREMRSHSIVAVVEDVPKQVLCIFCKSRHGYRTGPVQRASDKGGSLPDFSGTMKSVSKDGKPSKERQKFEDELLSATSLPPFDPKGSFKPGQIIAHPKWGRGKIESVLRGSLLVRFLDGLRQVSRT